MLELKCLSKQNEELNKLSQGCMALCLLSAVVTASPSQLPAQGITTKHASRRFSCETTFSRNVPIPLGVPNGFGVLSCLRTE